MTKTTTTVAMMMNMKTSFFHQNILHGDRIHAFYMKASVCSNEERIKTMTTTTTTNPKMMTTRKYKTNVRRNENIIIINPMEKADRPTDESNWNLKCVDLMQSTSAMRCDARRCNAFINTNFLCGCHTNETKRKKWCSVSTQSTRDDHCKCMRVLIRCSLLRRVWVCASARNTKTEREESDKQKSWSGFCAVMTTTTMVERRRRIEKCMHSVWWYI